MTQRVLVVDDSEDIHLLIKAGLRNEPIVLSFAPDGATGLSEARRHPPDLILLDVDMPEPDGFSVCRSLKDDPATAGIPVVFLTGASSAAEKVRGLDLGAIDYITKPFDSAELRARVSAGLRTKYLLDLCSQRAMLDGLTGLWNRAFFDQRLASELSLSARKGTQFSCIIIDIDNFKAINDSLGHPGGDEALRAVAQELSRACRIEDAVCRIGGDEFAILMPGSDLEGAVNLAQRICQSIANLRPEIRGKTAAITCSIGVADSSFGNAIVDETDRALYRAKLAGRNRVVVAEKSTEPVNAA